MTALQIAHAIDREITGSRNLWTQLYNDNPVRSLERNFVAGGIREKIRNLRLWLCDHPEVDIRQFKNV